MDKHTPEPWTTPGIDNGERVISATINGKRCTLAHVYGGDDSNCFVKGKQRDANARRIVACVNACQGISTEALESCKESNGWMQYGAQFDRLAAENKLLLEALLYLEQAYTNKHSPQHRAAALIEARAILAKGSEP